MAIGNTPFDPTIPDLTIQSPSTLGAFDPSLFAGALGSNAATPGLGDLSGLIGLGSNSGFSGGSVFVDVLTGQTVSASQIQADPSMSQAFQTQFGVPVQTWASSLQAQIPSLPFSMQMQALQDPQAPPGTPPGGPGGTPPPGKFSPSNPDFWQNLIGGGAAALGGLGGLAGIIQALRSGGQTSQTVNKFPPPTDQQLAIQRQGLQNLQGAGQFAFGGGTQTAGGGQIGAPGAAGGAPGGLGGLYGSQQPFLNAAFLQALQQQAGQIQNNPFLGQGLQQFLGNQTQALGGQQAGLLGQAGQNALGFQPSAATPAILSQILGGLQNPLQPNPLSQMLSQQAGQAAQNVPQPGGQVQGALNQIGQLAGQPLGINPLSQALAQQAGQAAQNVPQPGGQVQGALNQIGRLAGQPLQPSPWTQAFLGQVPGLPNQLTPQGVIGGLQGQAAGMQQGQLAGLSPELLQLINQTYAGGEAAIQREADQALQGALEQARKQGFAGGLEQFQQGTPGSLLAPGLQTATRERAMLEGQKAQSILGLMQGLPMEGGQLATTAGNLAQQNLGAAQGNIQLGLGGAQNLFGQGLASNQALQHLLGMQLQGAQVPFQQALQGFGAQQGALGLGMQGAQNVFGQGLASNQALQRLLGMQLQGSQIPFQQALQGFEAQQGALGLGLQGAQGVFGQGLQGAQLQQALQSLGLQGAQQQFGQQQGVNQNLLNTAQAFQNPFAMALQGGTNLSGLNQNMIQSLFGANNAGLGLQNQFLGALGGQSGAAGALSNAFQPLGSTQSQTQPFNLLSAMAPTANLLGGIGGVLTAMNPRPQINFQLPGGTTV